MENTENQEKKPSVEDIPKAPESFLQIICDLTADLNVVYPEYSMAWAKWTKENLEKDETELNHLFQYCMLFYPERFFDILYKNEEIFKNDNPTKTLFLPNVEFKALYNCDGVSQKTRDTIWKYLQLILFSVVQVMKDSSLFGKSVDMFQNVDAEDLRSKLDEVVSNMTELFVNFENIADELNGAADACDDEMGEDDIAGAADASEDDDDDDEKKGGFRPFTKFDAEKLHSHINNLLNGKIGSLAKELAEDVSREFSDEVSQMEEGMASGGNFDTKTLLSKMIKNPEKMCNLVKKIGGKLDEKMKSGEVSQEELMKEAADIMEKMKDIPGMKDMKSILKQFGKGLGGMAGGLGKDVRVDTNAMNNMSKNAQMKEKLRARLEAKKRAQVEAALAAARSAASATTAATNAEFPDIDPSLLEPEPIASTTSSKKSGGGKKKSKK